MLAHGEITQRQFARYQKIWENSAFRSNSLSHDRLFARGGWAALQRRHCRARKLHLAWYNNNLEIYLT